MTGADRRGGVSRAAFWAALLVALFVHVGCARTHCSTQPLAMHWADGTTTTWPITVCRRSWL